MTITSQLQQATTHADLRALTATLRGKALRAELAAVNLEFMANQKVDRQRAALAEAYGRNLDARAISRLLS